jgi:hypothetical protein
MKVLTGVIIFGVVCLATYSYGASREEALEAYAKWRKAGTASPAEKALMEEVLFPAAVPRSGRSLDNAGGPDGFGYSWMDNQNGDTVSFGWIELCGDTLASYGPTGDDEAGLITWGFPFPFYGSQYSSAYVSINGKLAFDSADANWLNQCSTMDAVQPVISVYWDDLVAQQTEDCGSGTPRIKYRDFGDRLVIEWKDVWHYPYSGVDQRYTFETILYANGRVKMQYDTLNCGDYCNSATVAIDVPGPDGIEYVCNGVPQANQLDHGRAVLFYTGSVTPPQDVVIISQSSDIMLVWRSVSSAEGYSVYRGLTSEVEIAPANLIAATADTTYTDIGILDDPDVLHFYVVTATVP